MSDDKSRGIYRKYDVKRTDGGSEEGGAHENCRYFVLDLDCDPFSIPALKTYADHCRSKYPKLAEDLDRIIDMRTPADKLEALMNKAGKR